MGFRVGLEMGVWVGSVCVGGFGIVGVGVDCGGVMGLRWLKDCWFDGDDRFWRC